MRRPTGRPLRVLHCPAVVGGHAVGLARAERELGLASRCVAFHRSPYGFPPDEVLFPPGSSRLSREVRRWAFLRRALRDFDVVHFNFGSSISPRPAPPGLGGTGSARRLYEAYARVVELRDLTLLRRRGLAVFVTYQGDDARHGEAFRARLADEVGDDYHPPERDGYQRRGIAAFERHAHGIFTVNPDLLDVLPGRAEFVPYASVDPSRRALAPPPRRAGAAVVVHAPTDRRVKGTRHVVEAVERLRADGVEVELELVEGRTQADALAAYERADVVVDQLLIGWYGSVAVEAMALGRPVVAHIRESDLDRLPAQMRADLPVVDATPATVADVLRRLVTGRRGDLAAVGRRGREYVERWHDPRRIARRMRDAYERAARS